jgi:hypothetical protein
VLQQSDVRINETSYVRARADKPDDESEEAARGFYKDQDRGGNFLGLRVLRLKPQFPSDYSETCVYFRSGTGPRA